jgi:5-methylcytosine-specific restriction endonuclease McrA
MADEVRYRPNGDNAVLRHVLCEVWDLQCYWCREFRKYLELQIDHIVPQKDSEAERERLREAFKLDADYDVDAVANLAPICAPCNGRKSNADMTQFPVVLTCLKKARQHAPTVTKRFQAFTAPSDLGGALLTAVNADLDDPDVRAAFEVGAPAIVQRLAELGEGKADYFTHREVTVEARDEEHSFFVSLNEQGRAAVGVLEQVAGGALDEVLAEPVEDLFTQTEEAIANALREHDDGLGAPDVGSVSIDWPTLSIGSVRYSATAPAKIEFEFEGAFEGLATGSVARDSADGDGLEDVQGDATFSTRFKFDVVWELGDDGEPSFFFDQVWLEDFDADTLVDGRSSHVWWDWPQDPDEPEPEEDD